MFYAINFLVGMVAAMIATLPLGPVNLEIVQRTINKGYKQGMLVAVGSAITEMLWCGLAVYGTSLLFASPEQEEKVFLYFKLASIPLLFILGVVNLRKKVPRPKFHIKGFENEAPKTRFGGAVAVGASLNLLNPVLLAFWLAISAYLKASNILYDGLSEESMYTFGVGAGTFATGSIISLITIRSNKRMSYRSRVYLTRGIGFTFLVFMLYQAYSLLVELVNNSVSDVLGVLGM